MDAGHPLPSLGKADAADGGRRFRAADPVAGGRPGRGADLRDAGHPRPSPDKAGAAGGGHPRHGSHGSLWVDRAGDGRRFRAADPVAGGRPGHGSETVAAGRRVRGTGLRGAGHPRPAPGRAGAADGGRRLLAAAPPKSAGPPGHGDPDRPGRPAVARGRGSPRRRCAPGFRRLPAADLGGDPRGVSARAHRRPARRRSVVLSYCPFLHAAAPSTRI